MSNKLLIFMMFFVSAGYANEVSFPFDNSIQEKRFSGLLQEVRCLVCQNQSLAESNTPISIDLKREIYAQIQSGHSDETIKSFLTERYGEYILYNPLLNQHTLLLWIGPIGFLLVGILFFIFKYKQRVFR